MSLTELVVYLFCSALVVLLSSVTFVQLYTSTVHVSKQYHYWLQATNAMQLLKKDIKTARSLLSDWPVLAPDTVVMKVPTEYICWKIDSGKLVRQTGNYDWLNSCFKRKASSVVVEYMRDFRIQYLKTDQLRGLKIGLRLADDGFDFFVSVL